MYKEWKFIKWKKATIVVDFDKGAFEKSWFYNNQK